MPNVSVTLPSVANGDGASVDVQAIGASKTLSVSGTFTGSLTLQASNDNITFVDAFTLTAPESITLSLPAAYLRIRSRNAQPGAPFAPSIQVTGPDSGVTATIVPAPPINGTGAAVAVTGFGQEISWIIGGDFTGVVAVEVSDDGVAYSEIATISAPDIVLARVATNFTRLVSRGANASLPFAVQAGVAAGNASPDPGVLQTQTAELLVDFTTTVVAPVWDTVLTLPINTSGGDLLVWVQVSLSATATVVALARVLFDGVPVGIQAGSITLALPISIGAIGTGAVAPGPHTLELQLAKDVGSPPPVVLQVRAATEPLDERAVMIAQEVS